MKWEKPITRNKKRVARSHLDIEFAMGLPSTSEWKGSGSFLIRLPTHQILNEMNENRPRRHTEFHHDCAQEENLIDIRVSETMKLGLRKASRLNERRGNKPVTRNKNEQQEVNSFRVRHGNRATRSQLEIRVPLNHKVRTK